MYASLKDVIGQLLRQKFNSTKKEINTVGERGFAQILQNGNWREIKNMCTAVLTRQEL